MHDELLRDADFWRFLLDLDRELAQSAREKGCSCGGRLHAGNYFRNPRGGPVHDCCKKTKKARLFEQAGLLPQRRR